MVAKREIFNDWSFTIFQSGSRLDEFLRFFLKFTGSGLENGGGR